MHFPHLNFKETVNGVSTVANAGDQELKIQKVIFFIQHQSDQCLFLTFHIVLFLLLGDGQKMVKKEEKPEGTVAEVAPKSDQMDTDAK